MDRLPTEVLTKILFLFSWKDHLKMELVCKKWRLISRSLWDNINGLKISIFNQSDQPNFKNDVIVLCFDENNKIVAEIVRSPRYDYFWYSDKTIQFLFDRCSNHLTKFEMNFFGNCFDEFFIQSYHKIAGFRSWIASFISLRDIKEFAVTYNCTGISERSLPNISPALFHIARLIHLTFENAELRDDTFVHLCQQLSPTLQYFCFKEQSLQLQPKTLISGLKLLINLKHLNLGSCIKIGLQQNRIRTLASKLDDKMLSELSLCLTKLETLNLHGAVNVTSAGIVELINHNKCASHLSHLGINCCPKINNKLLDLIKDRSEISPLLTIFGLAGKISAGQACLLHNAYNIVAYPSLDEDANFKAVFSTSPCICKLD